MQKSLINHNEFSPSQLVFSFNPNLPNNINNALPALKPPRKSSDLASHISALHATRKAFVSVKLSEKLKMALSRIHGISTVFQDIWSVS